MSKRAVVILAGLVLTGTAGCDPTPLYTGGDRKMATGTVTDRRQWTATGTVDQPASAVDGNINTIAVARENGNPASLTIDLGNFSTLNMVVIDHGRNEFGFARQVAVSTSLDGQGFARHLVAGGTRQVSSFLLLKPILCRFMRLEVVAAGEKPWSVAEVHFQ